MLEMITVVNNGVIYYNQKFTTRNKHKSHFIGGIWYIGHPLFPRGRSGAFSDSRADAIEVEAYWYSVGAYQTDIVNLNTDE
jgi:hypothetical protein